MGTPSEMAGMEVLAGEPSYCCYDLCLVGWMSLAGWREKEEIRCVCLEGRSLSLSL